MILYYIILYYIISYYIILYHIVLNYVILYCIILYYILYYMILNYIILYFMYNMYNIILYMIMYSTVKVCKGYLRCMNHLHWWCNHFPVVSRHLRLWPSAKGKAGGNASAGRGSSALRLESQGVAGELPFVASIIQYPYIDTEKLVKNNQTLQFEAALLIWCYMMLYVCRHITILDG